MISVLFGAALVLSPSTASLPLYVDGEGVLRFEREGRAVYARDAVLEVRDGRLVNSLGHPLLPEVSVAGSPDKLEAALDGTLTAVYGQARRELGRIVLARFGADFRLIESKGMLIAGDRPKIGSPGEDVFGVIRSGRRPQPGAGAQPSAVQTPIGPAPAQQAASPAGAAKEPQPRPAPGIITVAVRQTAEIDAASFTLGDLAEITGPEDAAAKLRAMEIGATPALGVVRPIDRLTIEARIARAGFLLERVKLTIPDRVTVVRKGQPITHEDFVKAATTAAARGAAPGVQFESAEPGPAMIAPKGELILTAGEPTISRDRATVTITVSVDGKRFNSRTVALKITTPLSGIKAGDSVKLRVKSGSASVETTVKVRSIDLLKNQATVETSTGATLTAIPGKDGVLEVIL